jgi:hypothetical protein
MAEMFCAQRIGRTAGLLALAVAVHGTRARAKPAGAAAEFPSDTPQEHDGHLSVTEVDLYGGPSLANGGAGGGFGTTGQLQWNVTWPTGWSSQISGSVTGGYYGVGGSGGALILNAAPEFDFGYWNQAAMVSGVGGHFLLSYFGGSANIAGTSGALYSYTPEILVGLHGRDAARASPWSFSVGAGVSVGYASGTQAKLDPDTGGEQHVIVDPYFNVTASTDQRVGDTYLRVGASASDRVDSVGDQGTRQLFNGSAYAWLKVFGRYYTGPQLTMSFPTKRPDLTTRTYVDGHPVVTASLYFGGAL